MKNRRLPYLLAGVVALALAGGLIAAYSATGSAEDTAVAALAEQTHFHGVAVARDDPDRIYLATHHGLYTASPEGRARLISDHEDDLMGFTAHPEDPQVLYASGHPAEGGNLGFIVSQDGGETWEKRADGVGGPVDFHQMDVSKADTDVIYGAYRGLQRSTDAGHTWEMIAPEPEGLISLAASSRDVKTIYAATQGGLLKSTDAGRGWERIHPSPQPATKVYVTANGEIYAYAIGAGLIRAAETDLEWQSVGGDFGNEVILHFGPDPSDTERMFAVTFDPQTRAQSLYASRDGGATWQPVGEE